MRSFVAVSCWDTTAATPIVVGNEENRFLILDQLRKACFAPAALVPQPAPEPAPAGRNTTPAATLPALQATQGGDTRAGDHPIRQSVEFSASELGITLRFSSAGIEETAKVAKVEPVRGQFLAHRPTEAETLLGDPNKVKAKLGWGPRITLQELAQEMLQADYESSRRETLVKPGGSQAYDHNE